MNTYYKILNEIAAAFDTDQWDEQVNLFTSIIDSQLTQPFVHHTNFDWIFILEEYVNHDFPQFDFYKERCYVNGEKVELDDQGTTENKWKDKETVDVIIKDLNELGKSCNSMFWGCQSLVSVPDFNTSKVTDMSSMFCHCEYLKSVPKFDTSSVITMYNMFLDCHSLSEETKQNWSSVYDFETDKMI